MLDLVQHHVQGHIVGQRRDDGYINLTELCQRAGKRWHDFRRQPGTEALLKELSLETGIPVSRLIQRVSVGFPANTATWGHPELAVHVAYWAGGPKWQARIGSIVVDHIRGLVRHQTYKPLLLPSPADWQKRFHEDIFTELGRLHGYERPKGAKNWPQWMGAMLKNDFYGRLHPDLPDLPDELDNRNPVLSSGYRDHKHHQDLTEEMGLPLLMERLGRFVMLLKVSKDRHDYRRNLFLHMPKRGDQGELDL